MNPFTVTAADGKKLMAVLVRWERGAGKKKSERQHGDGCAAG